MPNVPEEEEKSVELVQKIEPEENIVTDLTPKAEKRLIEDELGDKKQELKAVKKIIDKQNTEDYDLKKRAIELTEDEQKICDAIGTECIHVNDIIERSGIPTGRVLALLTILEIKGSVSQDTGKTFRLS